MARALKFCHISTFYPPYSFGGDAMYLYRLVNALARRGHEVDVIHCADSYRTLAHREPEPGFPNHPNVKVHTLRSRWGVLSPLLAQQTGRTWLKTTKILEVLYSKKFDVIHYHNISLFGPEVLRLEPDYRDFIKLYTTHEHWLVCPMHVLWKNNERLCESPQCLRCTLKFRRPPQWWRYTSLLKRSLTAVDAFISPSRFTRQMHLDRGFQHPMTVVPYFVPAKDLICSENPASPWPRPYFLFVGRLEKIKGAETLFPIFRGYEHADLLIAGTGTFEAELRRQAEGMPNIHFLGPLSQDRLRELNKHAIAVLIPSSCYEVFGIIIIEAYMQRTPVIAHDLGGLSEVVQEGKGGYLYQTSEEMLAAMERIRMDPVHRRKLGERGFQTLLARWEEDAHMKFYFDVLEETAQRKLGTIPWQQLNHDTPTRSCHSQ